MIWNVIVNVMVSYEDIEADTRVEAKKIAMEKAFEVDFSGSDFCRVSVNSVSSDGEDENEQIQEMARDICEHFYEGNCYLDKKTCDCKCAEFKDAQYLYAKGYRKVERGEWIDSLKGYCQCSNCRTSFETLPTAFLFKLNNSFCRHCGAEMKGE